MPIDSILLNLPFYRIEKVQRAFPLIVHVKFEGQVSCPVCKAEKYRKKTRFLRHIRHESIGNRPIYLKVVSHKFHCLECGRYFNQRFPGIKPYQRSTENFRKEVFQKAPRWNNSEKALQEVTY